LLIHQKQNSKITTSAWQSGVCLPIRNELPRIVLHLSRNRRCLCRSLDN
jgi:hypothetical protein